MFRNRRLRTKLVWILLVPIAALTSLAALQAWDRYDRAPPGEGPSARRELTRSLTELAAVAAAAAAFAMIASRAVARPIRRLTAAASTLATETLPGAVASLRSPADEDVRYLSVALSPIAIRRRDEVGQLATALNAVQATAVDLAAEQAGLVRKGIAPGLIELARTTQQLVEAQLSELDELEIDERDPARLERLFRVDHLAIRARRAVESLLVLAGVERERDVDDAVPLSDVVRAAIAQVAPLERVQVLRIDPVTVGPVAAIDLAHLLAELIDGALRSSPAETSVEVRGHPGRSGYVLSVSDTGVGMSGDRMAAANALLAHPPIPALAPDGQLGFVVCGRLAGRHGMAIRLAPGADAGVVALVSIPASALGGGWDGPVTVPAPAEEDRGGVLATDERPGDEHGGDEQPGDEHGGDERAAEHDPEDLDSLLAEGWADGWDDEPAGGPATDGAFDEAGLH